MSLPSALESEMLELVNQERVERGLNPLVFDRNLNASSETHSEWMQDRGVFSHTGQGGSSATERMRDAGFEFTGSWRSAENLAYGTEYGAAGYSDDVARLHEGLMNSAGHRANILNPALESIGIGIEVGSSALAGGRDTVVITQNFAASFAVNDPIIEFVPPPETPSAPTDRDTPVAKTPTVPTTPDLSDPWVARLDRLQTRAEKMQDRVEQWEARAEEDPARADRALDKVEIWEGRIDKLQDRLDTWLGRLEERWERRAESTDDTSDDGLAAANLAHACDDVDGWDVTWSSSNFCDLG